MTSDNWKTFKGKNWVCDRPLVLGDLKNNSREKTIKKTEDNARVATKLQMFCSKVSSASAELRWTEGGRAAPQDGTFMEKQAGTRWKFSRSGKGLLTECWAEIC